MIHREIKAQLILVYLNEEDPMKEDNTIGHRQMSKMMGSAFFRLKSQIILFFCFFYVIVLHCARGTLDAKVRYGIYVCIALIQPRVID